MDGIATSTKMYSRPLADVMAKIVCSSCKARPQRIEAECVWVRSYDRSLPRIDLTWLMEHQDERQPSLL